MVSLALQVSAARGLLPAAAASVVQSTCAVPALRDLSSLSDDEVLALIGVTLGTFHSTFLESY